ncbi:PIR Superfamily Protein [Plasmodium ovale wallikeri]|uniref:PIR protein n=2 Tax=Plasmodium ovale TaxID=36330 RepID=A0A1C3KFN6_PLAOA|nr:PIR Superfamily Protein [Plasmodium ovale wallikeri]SBT72461.1 PIR protein [Plasmodium ovale]SBT74109.1 PIR protein [Plasmodium ovale]
MEERNEVLKRKLSSFDFDLKLNNSVANCEYCSVCEIVDEKIRNEPWFKIFCYQFVRNVQTVYEIIRISTHLREKHCKTLTYWIREKIKNFYEKNKVDMKNVNVISELSKVWEEINSSKCKGQPNLCESSISKQSKNLEEMKREKIMSAYCENYDTLKNLLTKPYTTSDCYIYYSYFKDSFDEFSKIATENNKKCLEIKECLRFCHNADPNNLIKVANCKVVQMSKDNNEYIEKEKCDTLKDQAVPEKTCETREFRISEFTFSDNRAIILILFSLWGIFLSFLFLYKMTPFRAWISNKLGKKKIIRDNFNEQSDDETFDVDYETADRNMQNTEYNIIYNSDWNSSQ